MVKLFFLCLFLNDAWQEMQKYVSLRAQNSAKNNFFPRHIHLGCASVNMKAREILAGISSASGYNTSINIRKKLVFQPSCEHREWGLRGAWRDRDTNDIFARCSLISYFLDFKFSNFICLSELHPLIWFFFKKSFQKKEKYPKNHPKRLSS